MKKLFLMMTLLYTLSLCAWCEEGTTFIAQTPEGCSMMFTVISEKEKTVCVGNESEPAIDSETKGKITIPAIVNGYKVTRIGVRAFVQCDQIEEIVIPEGITSIGSTAFHSCEKLQSINIPEGVTTTQPTGPVTIQNANVKMKATTIELHSGTTITNSSVEIDGYD